MSAVLPDARVNKNLQGTGLRARVQKFGGYLAGMIMPNIGAFIAWGLITAMFIPTGWTPNEDFAKLVGPMIVYLLPVLIGYTGGRMVHGQRGAVIGAIATMGVIVGADVPMFLGAMAMGPLAAYLLRLVDRAISGKVKTGFEMLVDNFSLGILGGIMALIGKVFIGPIVGVLVGWAGNGVEFLVNAKLLPIASLFVEPAKVLFLNNAINHGVLSPLGAAQAQSAGQSILFMVESNPGPGLGLLVAFMLFGPRSLRPSTPGAIIIHFLGGIHEIYFPYVLMKPRMILATIAGGASGLLVGSITGAGLVAPPSPGSIFAYLAVTPKTGYIQMLLTVTAAAAVSFIVAALLFGFGATEKGEPLETPEAQADQAGFIHDSAIGTLTRRVNTADVKKLIITCDAGMGSSAMVAAALRKQLEPLGVAVEHAAANEIPKDARLILCHEGLVERARNLAPKDAVIVPFSQYMGDPAFTRIEKAFKNGEVIES